MKARRTNTLTRFLFGPGSAAALPRLRMQVEELEPRILHSADLLPSADLLASQVELRVLEPAAEPAVVPVLVQEAQRRELVIVDTAVADYRQLVDDIVAGADSTRTFEIVVLDAGFDGIEQVTAALSSRSGIDAVHLISHGTDGEIRLGSTVLDRVVAEARSAEIAQWARAFAADGDLLVYGCDVAATKQGTHLTDALARLTGADVAASEDATGHAGLGGDWLFEYVSGTIEASAAVSVSGQHAWTHTLTSDIVIHGYEPALNALADYGSEVTNGSAFGQGFNYDSPGATYAVDKIGLVLHKNGTAPSGVNITVSLRSGAWNGTLIAQGTISTNALASSESWETIALTSRATLNDSTTYFIRVDYTGSGGVFLGIDSTGGYAGGQKYPNGAGVDIAFRLITTVANTAPVLTGANNLATMTEDAASNAGTQISALISGHVSDADAGASAGIAVVGVNNANGTWQYSTNGGAAWTAFGAPSAASARLLASDANTYVRFVPNAHWHGTVANGLTFRAWDQTSGTAGGTADTTTNGGGTAFSSSSASSSITVTAVNDAPVGTSATVTASEDTSLTFTAAHFAFTDPGDTPANNLSAVRITTLPGAGSLTLNGGAVSAGQFVSLTDITAGRLVYTAALNASGAAYTSFTFEVQDDGGTANGGVDLDGTPRTMAIDVTSLNDAPINTTPGAQSTAMNVAVVFSTTNSNAITVSDIDAGASALQVTLTATHGVLTLSGTTGLTFSLGTGTNNPSMTFTGSAVDINVALNGLRYNPNTGYSGPAQITITTDDQGNTGNGGALSASHTVPINIAFTNTAPTLTGANPLAGITEDSASNLGTSVSALIAGHVTDPDVGALAGIAVIAADNSNGVWEYSTDQRATWTPFTTPTASAARLLAADSNSYVRFVPNAGWYGTVASGLTFRAWDQTSGNAGQTADTTNLTWTLRDDFGAVSYSNQDGTASWSSNWVEEDDNNDPGSGNVLVSGARLEINTLLSGAVSISRGGNLAGASSATLTLDYTSNVTTLLGTVSIEVSTNGGTSWTALNGAVATGSGSLSYNLTPYMSASTRIKFQVDGVGLGGRFTADNVQISYVMPLNGGSTAFSSATASSSITVASVNDAPAGASNTVTAFEDTAFTFTAAHFGFSDANDTPANTLAAVKITTLPSAGSLTLGGVAVVSGQIVSVADINSGNLKFTAAADANGAAYTAFSFQVQDDGGTANGGVDLDPIADTLTINVTPVNDAPVLTGANPLVSIDEDLATNTGTLVSALVSGHFSDSDTGALSGMAVTAVDNSNGTWQYSTNGGGSWSSFGFVGSGSARLLAADANTYVRFVPNANWNGTVTNGLTFRGWDRTVGINGGVAPTISNPALLDNFSSISYSNENGTAGWSTGWVDADASASGGDIGVKAGVLEIRTKNNTDGPIYRQADLTYASSATLSFSYTNPLAAGDGGGIVFEISSNGGASYTTLATFSDVSRTGSGVFSQDVSAYASSNTRIQFRAIASSTPQVLLKIDNVQIAYVAAGNGGATAFSTATASSSITVNPVNDAPAGANNTVTTREDTPVTLTAAHFGFSDAADAPSDALTAVKISSLPTAGTLTLNGAAVTAGQFVGVLSINAGQLVFTPAANANGIGYASFTFQVRDDGGTANGGVDIDPTARTITINVTSVSDAPVGASTTVTTNEDTAYIFGVADFAFSDADTPSNNLAAVRIATLPAAGALTLNGAAVTAGQFVSALDVNAGQLVFTPAGNANGIGYASFTFQSQDDGGTANGGADVDTTARTLTINVTPLSDPPTGTSATVSTNEDTAYIFGLADFAFSDADTPPNNLAAIRIATLPAAGAFTLNGVAVTAGQLVSALDINAGRLVFTPAANAYGVAYASFTFQVQDDGVGANLDLTSRAITIDVISVNDAPTGTSKTLTTAEDTALVISAADFGFTDVGDTPAHALSAVKIATVPTAGRLDLDGVAVSAGQAISASDITAGKLVFTPAANAYGASYASFTFQVQDSGGGTDIDLTPRTLTINVTALNDSPVGQDNTVTTLKETAYVFSAGTFGFNDPGDTPPNNFVGLTIVSLPGAGTLSVNGVGVAAGQFISIGDLDAGRLAYTPSAGSGVNYASFTYRVKDDGGGADLDTVARNIRVNVTAPVLAPVVQSADPVVIITGPVVNDTRVATSTSITPSGSSSATAGSSGTPASTTSASATSPAAATAAPTAGGEQKTESAAEGGAAPQRAASESPMQAQMVIEEPRPTVGATASPTASVQVQVNVPRPDAIQLVKDIKDAVVVVPTETQALMPLQSEGLGATGMVLSSQAQSSGTSLVTAPLENRVLAQELDQVRDSLRDQTRLEAATVAATAATGMSLSVGYVVWLLRGGALLSTFLSSLPAWRFIDPLPVLGRVDEDDDLADDDSLEDMVATHDATESEDGERRESRTTEVAA